MSRIASIGLCIILVCAVLVGGCTSVHPGSPLPGTQNDPVVGVWSSQESNRSTIYRFWENETFEGWSRTVNTHPRYVYQYKGEWKAQGFYQYSTRGPHIGYGEVTPLAIWNELIVIYEPASDTLSIPVYQDQVFSRLSYDPDAPAENRS